VFNTVAVRPRFSVVIAVEDRADVIGRAVAAVLAQTFAGLEVVVVDHGSTDSTITAVRAVADHRVRIVEEPTADQASARTIGTEAARGRWIALLDPDDEVVPGWLARLGRTIEATDAELVSCGGEQRHLDGSMTRILPEPVGAEAAMTSPRACFRPGAFVATRRLLLEVGCFGRPGSPRDLADVGRHMLRTALESGRVVTHTPEPLVRWNERRSEDPAPCEDLLRLRCSLQGIEALARTPIPDGDLLTRYAVTGGVAAARLRDRHEARRLFRLARRLEPGVPRHWARWAAASLPVVADRVWSVGEPVAQRLEPAAVAGSAAR
jgi:glycosyltransferase involved in cell wall biosynthesis